MADKAVGTEGVIEGGRNRGREGLKEGGKE